MKNIAIIAATLVLFGCVGEIDPDEQTKQHHEGEDAPAPLVDALIGGARTQTRPEIGRLYFDGGLCTATLISPRVIISARHCVGYTTCLTDACAAPYQGSFVIEDAQGKTSSYAIKRFESYDRDGAMAQGDFNTEIGYLNSRRADFWLSDDVAIALLDRDVPANVATPSSISTINIPAGEDLSVWGYGCTERGTYTDARKRYRDFEVGQRSNNLCPGDSGGPVTAGRYGAVRFVNSAYLLRADALDVFGDVLTYKAAIDARMRAWGSNNTPAPPASSSLTAQSAAPLHIADLSSAALELTLDDARIIQTIQIDLELSHTAPSDLAFYIQSPDGLNVIYQQANASNTLKRTYKFSNFKGKSAAGKWLFTFKDIYSRDAGDIKSFKITYNF